MNKNLLRILFLFCLMPDILFSQNIKVKELRPIIAIENGDYQMAIDSLNDLIRQQPKTDFYIAKANALFYLGKYDEALEMCKKADKITPNISSSFQLKVYLFLNDQQSIRKVLNENMHSKYKISISDLLNNKDYQKLNTLGISDSLLSENIYTKTEKQLYQVERLIQQQKYTQAVFMIQGIIDGNSNIPEAYYLQSKVSYLLQDYSKANQSIQKALELKSINSDYWCQSAIVQKELGQTKDALFSIEKAIRLNPYDLNQYLIWLELLVETEDYQKALEVSNQLLDLKTNQADVLFYKAKSFYKLGDNFEALKAINQSMNQKESKKSFELRGDIYTTTGTYQYAVRDYSMFLDLEARNGDIYTKKGLARFKMGDKKGACSDWTKAKRYGSYEAVKYLEKYCR